MLFTARMQARRRVPPPAPHTWHSATAQAGTPATQPWHGAAGVSDAAGLASCIREKVASFIV